MCALGNSCRKLLQLQQQGCPVCSRIHKSTLVLFQKVGIPPTIYIRKIWLTLCEHTESKADSII